MGSYFSKDYYTNEEKTVHTAEYNATPKFRILENDPRSASLGIVRTPIQVEATPKRPPVLTFNSPPNIISTTEEDNDHVKEDSVVTDHKDIDKQLTNEGADTSSEINNKLEDIEEDKNIESSGQKNSIKSKPLVRRYLETNLDDFITSPVCDFVLQSEKLKELKNHSTTEVNNAEISSVSPCTDHTTTLLDISDYMDDPSAIVTDNDNSHITDGSEAVNLSINAWLAQMESEMSLCSLAGDVSPLKSMDNQVQSNTVANKKLYLTPDAKLSSAAKVRTPLHEVKKNLLVESPSLIIKRKQWRCIQEERVKRGLSLDDENTPPPMPPFSNVPASAPGKMMHKRRITEWDKDSTVLI